MTEHLDDLLAIHNLLDMTLNIGGGLLLFHKVSSRASAQKTSKPDHYNRTEDDDECHGDAVVKHNDYNGNQYYGCEKQLRQADANHLTHGIDIIGVIAHHVAVEV